MIDVQNNGLKWGGKVKIQLNRYLVLDNNDRIYATDPNNDNDKVIQRNSLNDIHLRVGVSVSV